GRVSENARVYINLSQSKQVPAWRTLGGLFDTQARQSVRAPLARLAVHRLVKARAVAVHGDEERSESPDAELPDGLRIEVVQVHVLDRLHPSGLERRSAADDGEIGSAKLRESGSRGRAEPAFADDEANATLHERAREALHARRGRGADADRRVARRMLLRGRDLLHVRRRVQGRLPVEVEARRAAAVEERDQVRV